MEERALLRELVTAYKRLNESLFKSALRSPQFALNDASTFLGRWYRETRTIELSRSFALSHDWTVVLEVLKHEMAHQFVHEVLREDEPPHGPAFRATCARLGIDERAGGVPRRHFGRGTAAGIRRLPVPPLHGTGNGQRAAGCR